MKLLMTYVLAALFSLGMTSPALAETPDIAKLHVNVEKVASPKELATRSDVIAVVVADENYRAYATQQTVNSAVLVNYVQKLQVKQIIKGLAPGEIRLLTAGVKPLPEPSDPVNAVYSGPLAEGTYVTFLRHVDGTDLYSLTGVWQGVYPLQNGKTIALQKLGFTIFEDISPAELRERINKL